MARDYYGTLGVGTKASPEEIKRAYRKLARELHPDVNPDEAAQVRFREVSTAYEVLSDPAKRQVVDLGGDPLESGGGSNGFAGGAQGFGLGDIMDAFFGGQGGGGGRGPRSRVQPGSDALLRADLTLAECATGVNREINVDTAVLCTVCTGAGTAPGTSAQSCDTCGGAGEVQSVQRSFLGQVVTARICPTCRGVGEVIPEPCVQCGGDGRVRSRRTVTVKIPAGVGDGMRIRLTGQGEVGPGGGPAGDLYVEVGEEPHEVYVRDGDDLHCTVRVPVVDAALGTTMKLETIDGQAEITIDAGTQPASVVTLKGHGMPRLRSGVRGDVHVHLDVVVPTRMDGKQKDLLRRFATTRRDDVVEVVRAGSRQSGGMFNRLRDAFAGR
ncbi:MAG: molecular chaperone DnaJ [Mycobacteriaceae bacterium]